MRLKTGIKGGNPEPHATDDDARRQSLKASLQHRRGRLKSRAPLVALAGVLLLATACEHTKPEFKTIQQLTNTARLQPITLTNRINPAWLQAAHQSLHARAGRSGGNRVAGRSDHENDHGGRPGRKTVFQSAAGH